jgi:uncharacterized protein YhaN
MRVKTIDIDGFGVWNGLKLEDLSDHATVVYGPNEAGKTTLMQFVRAVLYGFTPERRKRYLPPVNGGRPGGRLQVTNEFGSFVVHRQGSVTDLPEDKGLVQIIDDRGEPREASQLEGLMAGIDEPTYSNVFAVGLKEIQELGSLDGTAAADYLYRLTSGLDRVSLVDVIREIEAARERLLASDPAAPSHLLDLIERRDKLRGQIEELGKQTRRWNDLAATRTNLSDEAAAFTRQIGEIETASLVLRAALDVQGPWNLRTDIQRQLEILKDVRQLPERSVEKLDSVNSRLSAGRKRLKRLIARRNQLKKDLESLEINKVLLSHAGRIESLHDQSQWIIGLENQITKLREEVRKLDGDIEAAVTGYRSAGSGAKGLDELPRETVTVLRRPAQLIREENDKLEKARQEADDAKRALDLAIEQSDSVSRSRNLRDLNQAIEEAGTKVSLLRKRIQVEERIDQLTRRRQELQFDSDEMHQYQETPLRVTALVGVSFAVGFALIAFGIFGGLNGWVSSGWIWGMFGALITTASVFGRLFLERHTEDNVTDNFRHLEQLRLQLAEATRERDTIDAELPPSSGSLDARLREAEIELRDLERLIPVRTEREQAEQRHQAAQRRVTAAQDAVKEARHRWKNALRSVGLPEDFAPPKVKQVVKNNDQILELRRRRDARKDELDQRERELLVINNRLQQILDDVRHVCTSDKPIVRIRELIQAVAKEKETLTLREDVEKRLRRLAKHRDKVVSVMRRASRSRHALLTLAGVEDEKGFRQAAADWARVVDLRRQNGELTIRIQTSLAGHCGPLAPRVDNAGRPGQPAPDGNSRSELPTFAGQFTEEQIAAVFKTEGRDIKARWDQRQAQLADIRSRLAQMHERRGAITHEMQTLAGDKQMSRAILELGTVEMQLKESIRRWKVLTIIGRLLEVVRKRYETDRQPETLREASQYLIRLTDGHYRRVWMPLDRRGLLVENGKGESLSLEVLSRGTREAVFIGLRLALAGSFARRGAMLPLVLDDVLVNFDSGRVRCAAEVLCDFARQGHQVIMFTCHEHITDIFEEARADVRVLPPRDGSEPVRRRTRPLVELDPPPPPPVVPEPAEPPRIKVPEVDPNPLLQIAALEEPIFDPVHPLPEKPRREKKRKLKPKLPDYWPIAEIPLPKPPPKVEPKLPDQWPLTEAPAAPSRPAPLPVPETFELLAFRCHPEAWPLAEIPLAPSPQPSAKIIVSPPEPTPPPPKYLPPRPNAERHRFTWESPEMYWDDGRD